MIRIKEWFYRAFTNLLFTKPKPGQIYTPFLNINLSLYDLDSSSFLRSIASPSHHPNTSISTSIKNNWLSSFSLPMREVFSRYAQTHKSSSLPLLEFVNPKPSKLFLFKGLDQRTYEHGISVLLKDKTYLLGVRGIHSTRRMSHIDFLDWRSNKVKSSFNIAKPLGVSRSFQFIGSKMMLLSLQSENLKDSLLFYQLLGKGIKKILKLNLDKCTSFDYDYESSTLFYSFGNDLVIRVIGKQSSEKKFSLESDIFAVKYVPEIQKLFVASNKIVSYDYSNLNLQECQQLDTQNNYISKIEFDPYSKTLYGFSFNCDIFIWNLNGEKYTLENRIINNFKSFYPMILNPLSKSIIINKNLEEFYEISLRTGKMKRWDKTKGTLLGFDRNSRQLIIQQKK